jgi:hypothetical protein
MEKYVKHCIVGKELKPETQAFLEESRQRRTSKGVPEVSDDVEIERVKILKHNPLKGRGGGK